MPNIDEQTLKEALQWIVPIFERHGVRYQLSGGLAARLYGSPRALNNVDFDIETGGFDRILPSVESRIVSGPGHFETAQWSNFLLILDYSGIHINIVESSTKIFDREKSVWTEWPVDFDRSTQLELLGQTLLAIPRERLVAYKRVLGREHDRVDIAALEKNPHSL